MARKIIVYWRDIPAQLMVRGTRREVAKRELPARFIEAIDACAMRSGLAGTDEYLEQWRRSDPVEVDGDIESEADRALAEIDAQYPRERLLSLMRSSGKEQ